MIPILHMLTPMLGCFLFLLILTCLGGGGNGSVQVLSDDMKAILDDPRNEKAMNDLMSQSNLTQWKILVDETGLMQIAPRDPK